MEKVRLEGLLIDYIDGKLSEAECKDVEHELKVNDQSYKLYKELRTVMHLMDKSESIEPDTRLRSVFEQTLKDEQKDSKQVFFHPAILRIAAAVILVISGIVIGYWINKDQQRENELLALKKEVEITKQLMMSMLANQQSASQRMLGATVAFKMVQADDDIVNALVKAMNEDPSSNVRLAALEALGKFHEQPHVRKALIASLATQTDPVVQISLIRLMVELKERESLEELHRISTDDELLPAVKDEAHAGILKMS